jgi:hypothetical protein
VDINPLRRIALPNLPNVEAAEKPVVVNQFNNEGDLIAGQLLAHTDAKSGLRTSEFWMTIGAILVTLTGVAPIPDHYKAILIAASAAAYAISRGLAKTGVAVPVEPKAPTEA